MSEAARVAVDTERGPNTGVTETLSERFLVSGGVERGPGDAEREL